MRRIWISFVAAVLLSIAVLMPAAAQDDQTLQLEEFDESGISGTVRLSPEDGQAHVSVLLTAGLEEGAVHPVHVHEGSCEELGDVVYPLSNIENGTSETTIDVSMMDLMSGEYAINAHLSEEEIDVRIACANIPDMEIQEVSDEPQDDAAEDDAAEDDGEEADDVIPATGSSGGTDADTAATMMILLAGGAVGAGVLVRRWAGRLQNNA